MHLLGCERDSSGLEQTNYALDQPMNLPRFFETTPVIKKTWAPADLLKKSILKILLQELTKNIEFDLFWQYIDREKLFAAT